MVSRTIMLAELAAAFDVLPETASPADYHNVIVDGNILAKRSAATRRATARWLRELYGLDPRVPVFAVLRRLWIAGPESRPLLAVLCACARDPLLRATADGVLQRPVGSTITAAEVAADFARIEPGRFQPGTIARISRNSLSSWTQCGHLQGRTHKVRARAVPTSASVTYALALGYLSGVRGALLFDTYWTAVLDAPAEAIHTLAFEASRLGWLEYRRIGDVIEVGFSALLGSVEPALKVR